MQPCNSSWPLPLAGGKVISTQTTQEKFSRRFQERGGHNCFGEHVKQGKALSTKSIDDALHNRNCKIRPFQRKWIIIKLF